MKKRRISKNIIILTLVAVLAIAAAVGGMIVSYQNGVSDGHAALEAEMSENLSILGQAVVDKSNFIKKMNEIFDDAPNELNTEKIESYISKLTELKNYSNSTEVQAQLNNLITKWEKFKETYASQDNAAIQESFNEMLLVTKDAMAKIKTALDQKITEAVDNL